MKKLIMASMLAATAFEAGTGRADEDRLNLWPLVGYDDGALDVIWPLGHFKDADEWRFFPIVRDHDLFCIFPELWFSDDGFAVLPLATEYDFGRGTVFPVVWWDLEGTDKTHSIFPAYYWHGSDYATTFWAGCGLAGYNRYRDDVSHWLLPVYAKTSRGFYSLPYSRVREGSGGAASSYFLAGLGGYVQNDDGAVTENWLFPLWHKDRTSFTTLPYHCEWNDKGEITSWMSILALSGGWQDRPYWKERYLLGLAGRNRNEADGLRESWCAPLYYANNRGTLVTPVYGQTEKAKWGLPGWYSDAHTFASPLWFHHTDAEDRLDQWMMPLLLSGGVYRDGTRKNGFLLNAAGFMSDDSGYAASWCMPLYFRDNDGTFVTPLYGHNRTSQWCFPLWYSDERSLYSALWCHTRDANGALAGWKVPLLLSGGETKPDGSHEADFLLGLGGATWGGRDGARSSWAFPFYYENSDGRFVTPLFGTSRESTWLLPLFYTDRDSFVSLPYAHGRNENERTDTYVIPPLLSGCVKHDNGRVDVSALLLYGHSTSESGAARYDYLLPLYYYDVENGNFTSLLYGSRHSGAYTSRWLATPLVGLRSGSKTGGWLFPLFNRTKDASFKADLARLDAPTIPDDITFVDKVHSWTNDNGQVSVWTNTHASVAVDSGIRGSVLVFSDHDRSVRGHVRENEYELTYRAKQGNRLVFNNETTRSVTYDRRTRRRVNDETESETMALGGLFYREHESDERATTSHTRTRVLWKLWDREERNGDVTVDAFPGFTYDAKTNGYSKTSFLWRFFRYENDPATGTKLDLLFLPIVR